MGDFLFLFFSVFTLGCALAVVFNRNAVNAAMCLMLCLAGVAGLFVQLDAFFLAFLLILVYAGAVVMLFLFIIMLLDVQGQHSRSRPGFGAAASFFCGALIFAGVVSLAVQARTALPPPPPAPALGASLRLYAEQLFTVYLLPVQIMGFLLLIAMLGVIALSQRDPPAKAPPALRS